MSILVHLTQDDVRRLGLKYACSSECLHTLIDRWSLTWIARKKAVTA